MAEQITDAPSLIIATPDEAASNRIKDIDRAVYGDPDSFMQACRLMGGQAIEHMPLEADAQNAHPKVVKYFSTQLRGFLENNDLAKVEFDQASNDAIYDHPSVKDLIKITRAQKSQRVKLGRDYVNRENEQAVISRDSLNVLKLFLYAKRTKQWQAELRAEDQPEQNGAA